MTGPDFTTALTTLGLDNHQAAQWLGVSVKSVRRYRVSGAPGPVAGMVRLALKIVFLPRYDTDEGGCYRQTNGVWFFADDVTKCLALDWRE